MLVFATPIAAVLVWPYAVGGVAKMASRAMTTEGKTAHLNALSTDAGVL
jgi:hypothetical protein